MTERNSTVPIRRIDVSSYTIAMDFPESDGTLEWDSTTLVLVHASAGGKRGLGYTYADTATARLIHDLLSKIVEGHDAMSVPVVWQAMVRRIRNLGRPGIKYAVSIKAGERALLPQVRKAGLSTLIVADGFSCKEQIE